MKLKDIIYDGRYFHDGSRYVSRRRWRNPEIVEVINHDDYLSTTTYQLSSKEDSSTITRTVPTEQFKEFVWKTFGDWEDEHVRHVANLRESIQAKGVRAAAENVALAQEDLPEDGQVTTTPEKVLELARHMYAEGYEAARYDTLNDSDRKFLGK
jgi:hypothetical protein